MKQDGVSKLIPPNKPTYWSVCVGYHQNRLTWDDIVNEWVILENR